MRPPCESCPIEMRYKLVGASFVWRGEKSTRCDQCSSYAMAALRRSILVVVLLAVRRHRQHAVRARHHRLGDARGVRSGRLISGAGRAEQRLRIRQVGCAARQDVLVVSRSTLEWLTVV